MGKKELKIKVPEGYEIDKENSTFECIKFKPKRLTYKDVAKSLFGDNPSYFINSKGNIGGPEYMYHHFVDSNNATSEKQLEKLLAINKPMNVRKYLCPDYVAKEDEPAYSIYIDAWNNSINVGRVSYANYIDVYFPNEATAYKAIDILGEDVIRLACSNDW